MGLAKITLSSKSGVYNEKYYLTGEKTTYNWVHNSATSTVYSSATLVTGQTPYNLDNVLYYIMNGTTTFTASNEYPTDDSGNGWTITSTTLGTVSNGNVVAKTVSTPTLTAKTWTAYTIAVGDIFYSDGALTHNNASIYSNRTQIGRVFCISTTNEEKTANSNWRHGWVVSNADASAEILWGTSKSNLMDNPTGHNINSHTLITTWMDGYGDTNRITSAGSSALYPAAWAAKNYSVSVTKSNSGWYLPSDGQFWTLLANLGGLQYSDVTTKADQDNTYMNWQANKSDVFATINNTYSLNLSGRYWSSSEGIYMSQTDRYNAHYWQTGAMDDGGNGSAYSKTDYSAKVRPVIAF